MQKSDELRLELLDLYSDLDLKSLLKNIAEKIKYHLHCEEASIILYNNEKEELYFEIATGEKGDDLKNIVIKKGEGVAGWVADNKKNLFINNCENDERFSNQTDLETKFKTRSIAAAPVIFESNLIGVVEAINSISGDFTKKDTTILDIFAEAISIPLQNAILYKKISQDSEEKSQLIELGKLVSSSFDYTEVFDNLKKLISDHITVKEINIMVNSTGKLYKLCEESGNSRKENVDLTRIGKNSALFPLRTEDKVIGFMEIKSVTPIPDNFVSLLRGLSIYAAISINKYEMYNELIEKEKIEKELEIAREIQQSFLIKEKIEIEGVEYDFINIPSSSVGGDYYDVIVNPNRNEVIFTINDIAGHGIPASLLMSVFRTNFFHRIKIDYNIPETFLYLNDLISETTESNLYLTSFTIKLDLKEKTLQYLNCGHSTQFIVREEEVLNLTEGTTVLGMFPGIDTSSSTIKLIKGDIIILYTDGVVEEENADEIQFSIEKLQELVVSNRKKSSEEIKKSILKALEDHTPGKSFNDDITFMTIKII